MLHDEKHNIRNVLLLFAVQQNKATQKDNKWKIISRMNEEGSYD